VKRPQDAKTQKTSCLGVREKGIRRATSGFLEVLVLHEKPSAGVFLSGTLPRPSTARELGKETENRAVFVLEADRSRYNLEILGLV
jgi:hypothetical protein